MKGGEAVKHGKKLTVAQKKLAEANGLDWRDWLRERDEGRTVTLVHRVTGKRAVLVK